MSFPLKIAVALIFALHQLATGAEICIWCNKKTERDFLACISKKISMNRELNIEPYIIKAMTKSLPAASSVINAPDNVKNLIMNGAVAGEFSGMIASIKSPGRNTDYAVANIIRSIEQCYVATTGVSGTKFATAIGRTVLDSISDADSSSDSNEYNPMPESDFGSKEYPNPPPFIENSPLPSPNQVFPAIQPDQNLELPKQTPFKSLLPSAESIDQFSPLKETQFPPNTRQNIDNGASVQGQEFSSPGLYASANANEPQNVNNYASFGRQDFPSPGSANTNAPQNRDNYAPFERHGFPPSGSHVSVSSNDAQNAFNYAQLQSQIIPESGSYVSSSANAPQNRNNFAPIQRQDFPASDSHASANSNNAQNADNFSPFQGQDFPASGSYASAISNNAQNVDNFEPFQRNIPASDSYASASSNVGQNRDNYAPVQNQDFPSSNSYAPASSNVRQNEYNDAPVQRQDYLPSNSYVPVDSNVGHNGDSDAPVQRQDYPPSNSYAPADSNIKRNGDSDALFQRQDFLTSNSYATGSLNVGQNEANYAPSNNDQRFLRRNNQMIPPQSPITPGSNQPSFVPAPIEGLDSNGPYPKNRIYSNGQPINPLILNPAERSVNRNPQESNEVSSSQSLVGGNNHLFQNSPEYGVSFEYKRQNIGPNGYYNGNNRWVANGIPSNGFIPQDYNPINYQPSGINSDENHPQTTQTFPSSFPLQGNLSPNYQPQYGQSEYQNSNNQLVAPNSFAVANSDDRGSSMTLPESHAGTYSLPEAPKRGNNNQPKQPSSFAVPLSNKNGFGMLQPKANEGNLVLAQDNFNGRPQTNSNIQINIPANDYRAPQNGLNSEGTSAQTTTAATTQVPTTPATTKAPATPKSDFYSNKTCALEFAEGIFVPLSESDSFNCMFNEETPHDQAVSVAANAIKNAFNDAGLGNYANTAKRNCIQEISQLSSEAISQNYAEKISKAAMVVLYRNNLLKRNCKEAGKFMAEQILKAISSISGSSDTDNNEQNEEPSGNEKDNSSKKNNVPNTDSSNTAISLSQRLDTASQNNYNVPQSEGTSDTALAVAEAASKVPEGGSPNNYKSPESDSAADNVSGGPVDASQTPEGTPGNNYQQRRFMLRQRNTNRRRGGYTNIFDKNAPGDNSNAGTPAPPQFSDGENPNYYNSDQTNNVPDSASSAAVSSNIGSANNIDNGPNVPASNEQPNLENNMNMSDISNSKENPLLNELKDPDSKNHIEYLMKTAMNCVSPSGFNYKDFTMGMASVATAMKEEHPEKNPGEIISKTYVTTIVALIEDLQNGKFNRQENNGLQSKQDSQPPPNPYRPNANSDEYGLSFNQQSSGSSAVAVANSESAPAGYQNIGNYQNTFQSANMGNYPNTFKSANTGNYQNTFQSANTIPLQGNMYPSLQNVGQNNLDITNVGNNLLNVGPREQPKNFGYNRNANFAYAATG